MTSLSERLIQILGRQAPLEWFRFSGGDRKDGSATPPIVLWRFKEPEARLEEAVGSAVRAHGTRVEWFFDRPTRNWVLTPRRVLDTQEERALQTDLLAAKVLREEDPAFCDLALEEFRWMVDDIERSLHALGATPSP